MNPIKKFFNNLKADKKFKEAGPGHRLNESSKQPSSGPSTSTSGYKPASCQSSEGARRAGAAALARVEQKQNTVNWSMQAMRAQAKKELELENAAKSKDSDVLKKKVQEEGNGDLTVSGVYFRCPILGPEILPLKEMEERIKTFLYEQYEDERGLTACLIIHTLNKNEKKLNDGIETLSRYLSNILDQPDQEKYRKIRINNKIFQERIAGLEGSWEFLAAVGFSRQTIDHEEFLVFQGEDFDNMMMLKDALLSAEPIFPSLDRNLKVLRPAQASVQINLPDDFFSLSADEIKREQESRTETVELMTQLRTKAMRERDKTREYRIYKYTLIRVRFPDGIIIQGTFYVYEKLQAVREFIVENLIDDSKVFQLLLPGGSKLDEDSSLLELKLVPAVLLNLLWEDIPEQKVNCLKPEVIALISDF